MLRPSLSHGWALSQDAPSAARRRSRRSRVMLMLRCSSAVAAAAAAAHNTDELVADAITSDRAKRCARI